MPIIENALRQVFTLPCMKHQTLASASDSLKQLEVWMQTLEPGAATPPHYHECEEVLVILKGAGQFSTAGESRDFGPGTTLVAAPKVVHQVTNSGKEQMLLLAVFSETPARAFSPNGNVILLPWS